MTQIQEAPIRTEGPYLIVGIDDVGLNGNVRVNMDELKLEELAASIKEKGVLQPITIMSRRVVKEGDPHYNVVAGHRRFLAAKMAGLTTIPALLRQVDKPDELLEIQVIENLQREDLEPMDEAFAYHRLAKSMKLTALDIAKRVGKSQQYVFDRIRLITHLHVKAQNLLRSRQITAGHAILLSKLAPADQEKVLNHQPHAQDTPLFRMERTLFEEKPQLIPKTVNELRDWIDQNVRFDVNSEELALLHPETAESLKAAQVSNTKIIPITRDYMLAAEARSKDRTFTSRSWKECGKVTCEYAVLGVFVAGEDRGQTMLVCTRKDVCKKHWGKEIAERTKVAKKGSNQQVATRAEMRKQEQELRNQDEARRKEREAQWTKALPELKKAAIARLAADKITPGSMVGRYALNQNGQRGLPKEFLAVCPKEDSAEWIVRAIVAMRVLGGSLQYPSDWKREELQAIGVNVKEIIATANGLEIEQKKVAAKRTKVAKKK